jgi:hypothetical protein
MAEFFDDLETREPAAREAALFAALPAAVAGALRAPGWREHLGAIDPTTIINPEALARLPVLRKADLPEPQRRGPSRSSAQVEVVGVGALLNDGKVIADERPSTDECAMSQTSRLPRDRLVGNEALVNQPRLRLLVADNVGAPSVWTCSGFRKGIPSRPGVEKRSSASAALPSRWCLRRMASVGTPYLAYPINPECAETAPPRFWGRSENLRSVRHPAPDR